VPSCHRKKIRNIIENYFSVSIYQVFKNTNKLSQQDFLKLFVIYGKMDILSGEKTDFLDRFSSYGLSSYIEVEYCFLFHIYSLEIFLWFDG
jgi:hypothetical protein